MVKSLKVDELYWRCDPSQFEFETTADLRDLDQVIGQSRVVSAMRFGADMDYPGYNIFALGPPGLGKHSAAQKFLGERAKQRPVPNDCLYSIGVLRVVKSFQSCGKEYTLEPAIEELLSPNGVSYERIGPQHVLFTLQLVDLHEAYFTYTVFLNVAPLARSGRCTRLLFIWYMCRISQTDRSRLTKADALQ